MGNYMTNVFGSTVSTYNVYTGIHVYIPSFPDNPTSSFAKSGRWNGLRMRL